MAEYSLKEVVEPEHDESATGIWRAEMFGAISEHSKARRDQAGSGKALTDRVERLVSKII
jgi:hypothetical protein